MFICVCIYYLGILLIVFSKGLLGKLICVDEAAGMRGFIPNNCRRNDFMEVFIEVDHEVLSWMEMAHDRVQLC